VPKDRLAGINVLLTGASQGIGARLALALSEAGAALGLMARNEPALKRMAQEIRAQKRHAISVPVDLSNPGSIQPALEQVQGQLGRIDVLINAAGIQAPIGPLYENAPDAWEVNFQVNLFGPMRLIHAVLPEMMARRRGKIINFSGGGATAPRPNFSAYAASKAALVRLTETLAVELQPFNIQVNAVAPGAVNTQMLTEVITAGERAGGEYELALARARDGGTPPELVCELVVFLASAGSGGLTGKLISAPHDPWRSWAGAGEDLNASPLYTLRRLDPFTLKPLIKDLV
jgi:NAD(P)-dependent dehydrogenase (short-subunit alcohol dehydrogenase family)